MKTLYGIGIVLFLTFLSQAHAEEVEQHIRAEISQRLPELRIDTITQSPLPGIYEMTVGTEVVYTDANARYLFSGGILDLHTGQSITEQKTKNLKGQKLSSLDEKEMIIFGDQDAQYTVTAFTDIDCGYCRKLHEEIDEYIEQGIRIRYLAFPRAGMASESAKKAESVWCADDPNTAMTLAKQGREVEPKTCDNPVAEQYALGQQFGIHGTPALILEDGEVIPGYIPAKRLKLALEQREKRH